MSTIQHSADTCPGRPCSTDCDHVEFLPATVDEEVEALVASVADLPSLSAGVREWEAYAVRQQEVIRRLHAEFRFQRHAVDVLCRPGTATERAAARKREERAG